MSDYTVHLHPPAYPTACRPWSCQHEPQFRMQAAVHILRKRRGGNVMEVDHHVCLACGAPQGSTVGGNVLVDLQMLWERFGFHPQIGPRILALRDRWSRIATHLFDENGWLGRHERVSRMIDPPLTMKLIVAPAQHRHHVRMGKIVFDPSLIRAEPLDPPEAAGADLIQQQESRP